MRLLFQLFCAFVACNAFAAPLELRVMDTNGSGMAGVVLVLRSTDASRALAKPVDAVINQVNMQFTPYVLVVPTGSRISFPNSDSVRHQVYSFSAAKRFSLPLYRGTPEKPTEFGRAGMVTLGCNIHDNMRAYVYVVDGQYYGRTEADGRWKAADVPPGVYSVQIWHPLSRDTRPMIEQQITVSAAEPRAVLRNAVPVQKRPQSQIPANWDAY